MIAKMRMRGMTIIVSRVCNDSTLEKAPVFPSLVEVRFCKNLKNRPELEKADWKADPLSVKKKKTLFFVSFLVHYFAQPRAGGPGGPCPPTEHRKESCFSESVRPQASSVSAEVREASSLSTRKECDAQDPFRFFSSRRGASAYIGWHGTIHSHLPSRPTKVHRLDATILMSLARGHSHPARVRFRWLQHSAFPQKTKPQTRFCSMGFWYTIVSLVFCSRPTLVNQSSNPTLHRHSALDKSLGKAFPSSGL